MIKSTNGNGRVNWAPGTTVEIINYINAARMKSLVDALELLDTAGKLLTHNATAIAALGAPGTTGHVLTADLAQALKMKWASPAPGGLALIVHKDITSGQTEVEFDNTELTGYDEYLLRYNVVKALTSSITFGFQVSDDNGSTYVETSYDFDWPDATEINQTAVDIAPINLPANATSYISGFITLVTNQGTIYPHGRMTSNYFTSGGANGRGMGWWANDGSEIAVDACKITRAAGTGTMTGRFTLYGYTKT